MSQALCFNDVSFDVIHQNSQPWVRGAQIATALQYSSAQRIIELYTRHAEEFTDAMTAVVTLPTEGGPQETRIFSLRGCHLIAMFARTSVAKAFRRWVLDILETLAEEERQQLAPAPLPLTDAPITPDQQCTLQAIIKGKVEAIPAEERSKGLYPQIWSRFNNHFRVAKYAQLPQCRMSEAVEYLMVMDIQPAKALPPAPATRLRDRPAGPIETRLDELRAELDKFGGAIQDFRQLVQEIRRTASPLNIALYQRLGWEERCGISVGSLTECLIAASCDSERHAREAYEEAYHFVAQARTMARISGM